MDEDNPILHNQLENMQSLFAVRESELRELRAALEQVRGEKDRALAKARSDWEAELEQRLLQAITKAQTEVGNHAAEG